MSTKLASAVMFVFSVVIIIVTVFFLFLLFSIVFKMSLYLFIKFPIWPSSMLNKIATKKMTTYILAGSFCPGVKGQSDTKFLSCHKQRRDCLRYCPVEELGTNNPTNT